jgi:hypothetical protein
LATLLTGMVLPGLALAVLLGLMLDRGVEDLDVGALEKETVIFLSITREKDLGFRIYITLMRIRIQLFNLMRIRIRILLLVKVMRICATTDLQTRSPFWASTVYVERLRLYCEPLRLLKFNFYADPDSAFTLMRIRIQLPKILRIRIRIHNSADYALGCKLDRCVCEFVFFTCTEAKSKEKHGVWYPLCRS